MTFRNRVPFQDKLSISATIQNGRGTVVNKDMELNNIKRLVFSKGYNK